MKILLKSVPFFFFLLLVILLLIPEESFSQEPNGKYTIVIHGGAGSINRSLMNPEKELLYSAGLLEALRAGEKILADGGTALVLPDGR